MTDFYSGLCLLYKSRNDTPSIYEPSVFYSRLCDLLAGNLEGREMASMLYEMDKRLGIVKAVFANGEDFSQRYTEVASLLSEDEFISIVDTLKSVADAKGRLPKQRSAASSNSKISPKQKRAALPPKKGNAAKSTAQSPKKGKTPRKRPSVGSATAPTAQVKGRKSQPSAAKGPPAKSKRAIDPSYIAAGAFFFTLIINVLSMVFGIVGWGNAWNIVFGAAGTMGGIILLYQLSR
jgi:hypothetical protein